MVGATSQDLIGSGKDAKWVDSRIGTNISAFAPGKSVAGLLHTGSTATGNGTSFSAPYIAGIFAIACQAAGTLCTTAAPLYTALRNTGTMGTVTNTNGTPLTGSTSRFIRQQW